jgi:CO/xanthine dehydrogenase FAD-binding subunit
VKPAPFEYHEPDSIDEALALLEAHPFEAKALAGGQSLVPAMNFRLAMPAILIDLNRLPELDSIAIAPDGTLRIGAMTRQRAVERSAIVGAHAPLLREAMPHIAHPQIRNRGTVGGSLAHADPSAELPALMVALGARIACRSSRETRWVPARDFFVGLFATALEPGELLVDIAIPPPAPGTGWAFEEVARRHGDFALAGAAAVVTVDEGGVCRSARVVLFGVGEGPVVAAQATAGLPGRALDEAAILDAAGRVGGDIDPPSDIHASSAYRRQLCRVLVQRTLARAATSAAASRS